MQQNNTLSEERVYDDIAYSWHDVDDVSYPLEEKELRSMQVMEHVLDLILKHLSDTSLDIKLCADSVGYDDVYLSRIFRDYYEIPFSRFIKKLRLRQAARELKKGGYADYIGKKYGFSNIQSFSKAFRNEFGVSPRSFKKGCYEVPDMPLRHNIRGGSASPWNI